MVKAIERIKNVRIDSRIDTVLFDLDGTLLPMNEKDFMAAYFSELTAKAEPFGYGAKAMTDSVWAGTRAMMKNDGTIPNKERFWTTFGEALGTEALKLQKPFDGFYSHEFDRVKRIAKENPYARPLIDFLKERGYTLAVATNPLFPLNGNLTRMNWVGLRQDDFTLITSYESSTYCKPSSGYYMELLQRLGKQPETCIMVGNDATDDLAAAKCGLDTFLVKDHLINNRDADISAFKQGMFRDLLPFFGMQAV